MEGAGGRSRSPDHDHRTGRRQARARRAQVSARSVEGNAPVGCDRCDRRVSRHPRYRRRPSEGARSTRDPSQRQVGRRPGRRRQAEVAGRIDLGAGLRAAPGVGAVGRHPRDPAAVRERLAAPDLAAAPHRRAATHEADGRGAGVRRLRPRVQGRSVDRGCKRAARVVGTVDREPGFVGRSGVAEWRRGVDRRGLDATRQAVRRGTRETGPRRQVGPRARHQGRAQLRGPPQQQREVDRVLQEGAVARDRRSERARGARIDLHARREVPGPARDLSPSHRHRERVRRAPGLPLPHRLDPRGDAETRPTKRSLSTTRSSARRRTI